MVVIRLSDGSLFVWSPVPAKPELREQVDALGRVAYLVSPNYLHHLWLGEWTKWYPHARLYAPPGLRKRRPDLHFDGDLNGVPVGAWARDVDQVAIKGSFAMTEIVFLHWKSRTAIFGDLIENFPQGWFKGWRGLIARLDGIVSPKCGAPREWRWTFWNRRATHNALQAILDFEPEQVVVAHGGIVEHGGASFIRRGFRWLYE
jgi:hypothetical protein